VRIQILILAGLLGALGLPLDSPGQVDSEHAVRTLLGQISRQEYESPAESVVSRLGDETSVVMTKIIAGNKPGSARVHDMLTAIRMAYAAPSTITLESDREPRTTLFLLQYFDSIGLDPKLTKEVAEIRMYVVAQAKKVVKIR
jgi:hypothetical protein